MATARPSRCASHELKESETWTGEVRRSGETESCHDTGSRTAVVCRQPAHPRAVHSQEEKQLDGHRAAEQKQRRQHRAAQSRSSAEQMQRQRPGGPTSTLSDATLDDGSLISDGKRHALPERGRESGTGFRYRFLSCPLCRILLKLKYSKAVT